MKKTIIWAFFLAAVQYGCKGPSERVATVKADISGLEAGELVYFSPDSDMSKSQTIPAEAGHFTLHIPIKPGQGDWYRIWIGSTPTPSRMVSLYLDSGEMHLAGSGGGFSDARYSGSPLAEEYQDFTDSLRAADSLSRLEDVPGTGADDLVGTAIVKWITAHPASPLGTALLEEYKLGPVPMDTVAACFAGRSGAAVDNLPAQRLRTWIQTTADVSPGRQAPDFTMPDTAGKPVSLKSFRGKYVLVDFWASWCGPCRAENPNVVNAYQQYKNKGFTVLGVSLDGVGAGAAWMKAIHKDQLDWTQVSDLKAWDNAAAKLYHIQAIPANFLIGPDGVIIGRSLRGGALENKLAALLH